MVVLMLWQHDDAKNIASATYNTGAPQINLELFFSVNLHQMCHRSTQDP